MFIARSATAYRENKEIIACPHKPHNPHNPHKRRQSRPHLTHLTHLTPTLANKKENRLRFSLSLNKTPISSL